jgi:hypothetical protein
VLYTLTGSETFRQLVMERGWSPDRFEEWLADSIRRLVIAEAAGDPKTGIGRTERRADSRGC